MWPFSDSDASATATQLQAQQQPQTISTTALPVQKPSDAPTLTIEAPSQPSSAAPHDPDFYAAHPHLAPPSFSTTSTSPSNTNTPEPFDELDPHLPRSMSCRAAFDSAFYCSSLGGHFNDIYRHGQLRSCNEHWNDFWFCMRTKNSYSGQDVKERLVQDRYREKENKLKAGPNSEDVWSRRGKGEEVIGAFSREAREEEGDR
jgi:hypothetical protein